MTKAWRLKSEARRWSADGVVSHMKNSAICMFQKIYWKKQSWLILTLTFCVCASDSSFQDHDYMPAYKQYPYFYLFEISGIGKLKLYNQLVTDCNCLPKAGCKYLIMLIRTTCPWWCYFHQCFLSEKGIDQI